MAGWKFDHDVDLEALAAEVNAGLVVGTWQYPDSGRRRIAFPGFDGDRDWSWICAANDGYYATAGAAREWAGLPPFVEGWVRAVDAAGRRREPPFDAAVLEVRVLSYEQWKILAPLIGSPGGTCFPSSG